MHAQTMPKADKTGRVLPPACGAELASVCAGMCREQCRQSIQSWGCACSLRLRLGAIPATPSSVPLANVRVLLHEVESRPK